MDRIWRNHYPGKTNKHQTLMNSIVNSILSQFEAKSIVFISSQELNTLLSQVEIILETDTLISHMIRILKVSATFWVQEKSSKNEIILRTFTSEKAAKRFVDDRLQIYEKMWDGCGCKIDYDV